MLMLHFLSTAQGAPPLQLTITKTSNLLTVQTGQTLEYLVTVTNNTGTTATNVQISDPIAIGLALDPNSILTAPQSYLTNYNPTTRILSFSTPPLQPGASITLRYRVKAIVVGNGCSPYSLVNDNPAPPNRARAQASNFWTAYAVNTPLFVVHSTANSTTQNTHAILFSEAIAAGVLNANTTNGGILNLDGNWVLDASMVYGFANCQLRMRPGAAITVAPNAVLEMNNVTMAASACNRLWHRILVQGDGVFKAQGSLIQDAQYAVEVRNKAAIKITDTEFRNNFIGIYAAPTQGTFAGQFINFKVVLKM